MAKKHRSTRPGLTLDPLYNQSSLTLSVLSVLQDKPHARAYFGVFRLTLGDEWVDKELVGQPDDLPDQALAIDEVVERVVAENSLNPQGIDAGIRKELLPPLFNRFGLDKAKEILDQIIHIVRVGLQRD